MSDVLSQSEIDNLLASLNSGELDMDQIQENDEKQIKDYDFKRPTKFPRSIYEHLRLYMNITGGWYPTNCRFISARRYR